MTTVGMPFASRCRATRLTVWWQTGQSAERSTASRPSSRHHSRIRGAAALRCPALAVIGGHPVEAGRRRPDAAAGGVFGQAVYRQKAVDVVGVGRLLVPKQVVREQARRRRVRRLRVQLPFASARPRSSPSACVLPAVVTNPTRHSESGFRSGVKGTSSWWAQAYGLE